MKVLIVVTEPDTYNSKEGSHLYRIERNLNWDFSDKSGYLQNHQVSSLSLTMSRADESVVSYIFVRNKYVYSAKYSSLVQNIAFTLYNFCLHIVSVYMYVCAHSIHTTQNHI